MHIGEINIIDSDRGTRGSNPIRQEGERARMPELPRGQLITFGRASDVLGHVHDEHGEVVLVHRSSRGG